MIYLKIIHATMKIKTQTIHVTFLMILGVGILLTNLALNRTSRMLQGPNATPAIQAGTVVATEEATDDEAGSTNWIMLVAVVIVLIVIIPILLKRQAWLNGKRNKTAPPG